LKHPFTTNQNSNHKVDQVFQNVQVQDIQNAGSGCVPDLHNNQYTMIGFGRIPNPHCNNLFVTLQPNKKH